MSADEQTRLVGTVSGDHVELDTSGRRFRPALEPIHALVNECKLHVNPEHLATTVVDPANVAMVTLNIYPPAFDAYELDGDAFTTGINLRQFTRTLGSARLGKRTDDPISLSVDASSLAVGIERDYGGTTVTQESELLTIDPDSIRSEPDLPDLDLSASVTVSPGALQAAVEHVDTATDKAVFTAADGDFLIGAHSEDATGRYGTAVTFDATVECDDEEPPSSYFSLDYLKDVAGALVDAKVDEVAIRFGDEFPAKFRFERSHTDGGTLYAGDFMVAPRIKDGDAP